MSPAEVAAKLRRQAEKPASDGALLRAAAALIDGAPHGVTVDLARNRAIVSGQTRRLCAREAEFLHVLVVHDGYTTYDEMADAIWGARRTGVSQARTALRQLAARVNRRLKGTSCRIAPVRGRGYELLTTE